MALKATIYKAELQIADLDRNYYADHALTLARHPSETDERMMVRLLAFVLYARDGLGFGKGLCEDDEPDLWAKDLTGAIELWIDVGQPDERWLRKACSRAREVVLIAYGGRAADVWWNQNQAALARLERLSVLRLPADAGAGLAALADRNMRLQCTVQDGQVWLTDGSRSVHIEPVRLT
ncbi:YaeQ family protein [Parasulfuritortus cantonensis]|uniref:YaeQ family protein n=1 Tax=Parasulfuritortus cantonensis TaxID=2528202 RepID=A0A4R1B6N9_9PROT|nr:YaeQ family protein [Parasulfuritortus cantonensis]TCJ11968.1 YaeQ family protein [Parasulfuritortus cantonensis]